MARTKQVPTHRTPIKQLTAQLNFDAMNPKKAMRVQRALHMTLDSVRGGGPSGHMSQKELEALLSVARQASNRSGRGRVGKGSGWAGTAMSALGKVGSKLGTAAGKAGKLALAGATQFAKSGVGKTLGRVAGRIGSNLTNVASQIAAEKLMEAAMRGKEDMSSKMDPRFVEALDPTMFADLAMEPITDATGALAEAYNPRMRARQRKPAPAKRPKPVKKSKAPPPRYSQPVEDNYEADFEEPEEGEGELAKGWGMYAGGEKRRNFHYPEWVENARKRDMAMGVSTMEVKPWQQPQKFGIWDQDDKRSKWSGKYNEAGMPFDLGYHKEDTSVYSIPPELMQETKGGAYEDELDKLDTLTDDEIKTRRDYFDQKSREYDFWGNNIHTYMPMVKRARAILKKRKQEQVKKDLAELADFRAKASAAAAASPAPATASTPNPTPAPSTNAAPDPTPRADASGSGTKRKARRGSRAATRDALLTLGEQIVSMAASM